MLKRKLFHASGVLVVLLYRLLELERVWAAGVLWGIVVLLGLLDFGRARIPALQSLFRGKLSAIVEEKDEKGWNGSTLYFAGCALAVSLFPGNAACAGILSLALGDPAAALVGSNLRSPRWGKVSVAGSLACFVAATAGCAFFFPWPLALLGGATATLLEAFSGTKMDNLTMPVGTALVLFLCAYPG